MGAIYRETLEFNESIASFRKALELNPGDQATMSNLASMLSRYVSGSLLTAKLTSEETRRLKRL